MTLANLKPRKLKDPPRMLIYGPEGVGKSSLAASAPAPIFMDVEEGSGHLEVTRYPFHDGERAQVPRHYKDVRDGINRLIEEKHSFKTLVLDTIDALEPLIWKHVCEVDSRRKTNLNPGEKKLESIEDFGYGKGYVRAVDEWRALYAHLEHLRRVRGMTIVLLAHAHVKLYKNPSGEDFDRYQLRIHHQAGGFLKSQNDLVGFFNWEEYAKKAADASGFDKAKGYSSGARVLYLERTAAFDAKTRYALPSEIVIEHGNPWKSIRDAMKAAS